MRFTKKTTLKTLFRLSLLSFLCSCSEASLPSDDTQNKSDLHVIFQTPIANDDVRKALSLKYLEEHHDIYLEMPTINPSMIVVHRSGCKDYPSLFNKFNVSSKTNEGSVTEELNNSAHYLIDKDGSIYQLLPNTAFARHVTGLNYSAIGIENVGGEDSLTDLQLEANILLIKMLSTDFKIDYVIGHYEYELFVGHPLWKEKNDVELIQKSDPNSEDMLKIRQGLLGLDLKPMPIKPDVIADALKNKIVFSGEPSTEAE